MLFLIIVKLNTFVFILLNHQHDSYVVFISKYFHVYFLTSIIDLPYFQGSGCLGNTLPHQLHA